MERYIYDEIKKEILDEDKVDLNPGWLIQIIAFHTHALGYRVPGLIPEDKLDVLKEKVKNDIKRIIRVK